MKRHYGDDNEGYDPGAKRSRHVHAQTRVVFVRALPNDCLESELLALCCPFAVVEKCLMIPQKCQAFVQLPDTPSATNLITFYQTREALIRGKRVFFEHSSREEVTVKPGYDNYFPPRFRTRSNDRPPPSERRYQPQHQDSPAQHHQQQQELSMQYTPSSRQRQQQQQQQPEPQHQYDMDGMAPQQQQQQAPGGYNYNEPPIQDLHSQRGGGGGLGQPHTILMVTVTKIEYDVTADVLQQVFQKFGNVQKIVTFWKNNEFKALVQMESVPQAQAAQAALDGRDIYTGCNQLNIIFSRHPELRVRYNNEQSRDFTNPNLPSGPEPGQPIGEDTMGYDQEPRGPPGMLGNLPPSSSRHGGGMEVRERERGSGGDYGRHSSASGPSDRDGGGRDRGHRDNDRYDSRPSDRGRSPGYRDRDDHFRPERHDSRGPPQSRYDNGPPPSSERSRDYNSGTPLSPGMRPLPSHSTGRSVRTEDSRSPVLICSNMDRTLVNPDRLFSFFGCFGDVVRVKVMFRKQDTALIQFVDDFHATSALDHLDGVVVFGKKLRVDYSKHVTVSMPHGEVDAFELDNTRDFTGSPLHRYRRRSLEHAVSPVPLLHISGIPLELQHNQNALVGLFEQYGFVKNFHYIKQNTKMALLEMGSLDEAVMALLSLDNLTYPDSHMRVSFSKAYQFTVGGVAPGGFGGGPGPSPMHLPSPSHAPRDRSRDRSRDRPSMRNDRGGGGDRYGGGGSGEDRGRGFQRDRSGGRGSRPDSRDSFRRPPPQRY